MRCKATGVITVALPTTRGNGKTGNDWERKEYVMKVEDIDRRSLKFSMISYDGPILDPPVVGDRVTIGFSIEASENKGRWFNDVKAYNVQRRGPEEG